MRGTWIFFNKLIWTKYKSRIKKDIHFSWPLCQWPWSSFQHSPYGHGCLRKRVLKAGKLEAGVRSRSRKQEQEVYLEEWDWIPMDMLTSLRSMLHFLWSFKWCFLFIFKIFLCPCILLTSLQSRIFLNRFACVYFHVLCLCLIILWFLSTLRTNYAGSFVNSPYVLHYLNFFSKHF